MTPLSSNPDKDPAKPIFLKAVQDLQSGKTEDAVKGFRKVLEISPAHSKSWTNLGMALLQRNKPEESKDAFQKSSKSTRIRQKSITPSAGFSMNRTISHRPWNILKNP